MKRRSSFLATDLFRSNFKREAISLPSFRALINGSIGYTFLVVAVLLLVVGCGSKQEHLFTLLPAKQTGIGFSNTITESDSLNPIESPNMYNGGGIAAADFNGDGKLDVFFTGNQVSNALYLNQGNWKFKDVTTIAGVEGNNQWNAGVAVVDINGDGRLDIYVCSGLYKNPERRRNRLYINQSNNINDEPIFEDMALAYGLADTTSTTNAAFFDYDNDGDLDVYLLVDFLDDKVSPNNYRPKISDGSSPSNDQLYRNDWDEKSEHPHFTNVTKEAGLLMEGYGLGINICDLNNDGWKDVFVTNDFISNDLVWINNRNGTFTNRAADLFKHTSLTAMGNDVVDLNNDGLPEIVAMDMMAEDQERRMQMTRPINYIIYESYKLHHYEHQYKRNTLQLNLGTNPALKDSLPLFSEIAFQAGIAFTDWSWTPLCFDADMDGYRDLMVTNGYARDITDNDFAAYQKAAAAQYTSLQLTKNIPQVKMANYGFRNKGLKEKGALEFEDVSEPWGINQASYSQAAVYGDFDNDGDLDYIVNNMNEPAFVYRNNAIEGDNANHHYVKIFLKGTRQNPQGFGAKIRISYGGQQQVTEFSPYRGYLSSQEPVVYFGLGAASVIDTISITWPDGKQQSLTGIKTDSTMTLSYADAQVSLPMAASSTPFLFEDVTTERSINFIHEEEDFNDFNFQRLLLHKLSQFGPAVAAADVNGDGLDDFFVGGSKKRGGVFFLQQGNKSFGQADLLSQEDLANKKEEDAGCLFFDADGDGDEDLMIVSNGYEQIPMKPFFPCRLYVNDGKGAFSKTVSALPNLQVAGSCVKAADYDNDGDLDLFIGGRVKPGYYPTPVSSYILRNDARNGQPLFTDVTNKIAKSLTNTGMVCDALWTDYNNDGKTDLLLAGEMMPITLLKNKNGQFEPEQLEESAGFWNSLCAADVDNDGDMDYIAGNIGYNTFTRPTPKTPLRVYYGDLNNDGTMDAIPSAYFRPNMRTQEKKEFPIFGRDEMIEQVIQYKRKFFTYKEFGASSMQQLMEDFPSKKVLEAGYTATVWIENKGGKLVLHPLPRLAQAAPVFGIIAKDMDGDQLADLLLAGNDFSTDLMTGRMDAFNGLFLKGDGKGGFNPLLPSQSGFYLPGDAKGMATITDVQGKQLIACTQNSGPLKLFALPQSGGRTIVLKSLDIRIEYSIEGRKRTQELYHGNTFYGQNSRKIMLPPQASNIIVTNSTGQRRRL